MTIRALIVDDEPHARSLIREYLADHDDIEIIRECSDGFEAVKAVTDETPDLIFLDVQMPKLTGFEVLDLIEKQPRVIFTTAYDEYALKAFEVNAVDYLLKPIEKARFDEAVSKVRAQPSARGASGDITGPSPSAMIPRPIQRILVRNGARIDIFPVGEIDFVEADDDYIRIVSGEKTGRKHQRLGDLEEQLDPKRFVRIHRSHIVNLDRVEKVEPYSRDSRVAILRDGTKLPVSRSGWEKLRDRI